MVANDNDGDIFLSKDALIEIEVCATGYQPVKALVATADNP